MSAEIDFQELVNRFVEQNSNVPEIQFIINEPHNVKIHDIEKGGVVNYVFRVQSTDGMHSVILKYGEEHFRCIPDIKIPLERQAREYDSLKLMDRIIPGSVPKPYCYDSKNHIICMEDLQGMEILGNDLRKGEINLETACNIGKILAQLHTATSKRALTSQEWQQFEAQFSDREIHKIVIDNLSERMFQEDCPLVSLPESCEPVYQKHVGTLLFNCIGERLKEKFDVQECFIHGANHWMSIFTKEGRIAFFDLEIAHLGNPDFNLAWVAISYYICMFEAMAKYPSKMKEIKDKTELAFRTLVDSYSKWVETAPAEVRRNLVDVIDFPTFTLFCGGTMFLFSVVASGKEFICLNDEQKSHLITMGAHIMLKNEEFKCLDDVTHFLFHSDEKSEVKATGDY